MKFLLNTQITKNKFQNQILAKMFWDLEFLILEF